MYSSLSYCATRRVHDLSHKNRTVNGICHRPFAGAGFNYSSESDVTKEWIAKVMSPESGLLVGREEKRRRERVTNGLSQIPNRWGSLCYCMWVRTRRPFLPYNRHIRLELDTQFWNQKSKEWQCRLCGKQFSLFRKRKLQSACFRHFGKPRSVRAGKQGWRDYLTWELRKRIMLLKKYVRFRHKHLISATISCDVWGVLCVSES